MKKNLLLIGLLLFSSFAFGMNDFSQAIRTCESYSQDGGAYYKGQYINILITLEKSKKDRCVYKEKLYQGDNYEMLTCTFEKSQLENISNLMINYNNKYKKEIAKNPIFGAKMTTNGDVFRLYLANPKYCQITHSKI